MLVHSPLGLSADDRDAALGELLDRLAEEAKIEGTGEGAAALGGGRVAAGLDTVGIVDGENIKGRVIAPRVLRCQICFSNGETECVRQKII